MINNVSIYKKGFEDGIRAYSWMKNGITYVGTTGKTLKKALTEIEHTWTYSPYSICKKDIEPNPDPYSD